CCTTNTGSKISVNTASITTVKTTTVINNVGTCPNVPPPIDSVDKIRERNANRRDTIMVNQAPRVTIPNTPSLMPARIITWPMNEKFSTVDIELNPVTVTAEVPVNAASTKAVDGPYDEANGMAKSTVKTAMTRANTEAVARAERPVARSAILRKIVSPPLWWSRPPGLYAECL